MKDRSNTETSTLEYMYKELFQLSLDSLVLTKITEILWPELRRWIISINNVASSFYLKIGYPHLKNNSCNSL